MKLITDHKDYWLLVDDSITSKEGDHILDVEGLIVKLTAEHDTSNDDWVIIAHKPLNGAKPLENILLLPEVGEDVQAIVDKKYSGTNLLAVYVGKSSYIQGYKAASDALEKFLESELTALGMSDKKTIERLQWYWKTYYKPKSIFNLPIDFIPEEEMEWEASPIGFNEGNWKSKFKTIKTKEHEILQGKYIYA